MTLMYTEIDLIVHMMMDNGAFISVFFVLYSI